MKTKSSLLKPVALETKNGVIATLLILIGSGIGIYFQWEGFRDFFFPNYVFLNWSFFLLVVFASIFCTWFIMNSFWRQEYDAHQITQKDRDNFMDELKISENARLTDVITGIPNTSSLERDINLYFSSRSQKKMQFILIDLKNFRYINNQFGYMKTNNLLRLISQTIYRKMRRNEDMYKYSDGENRRPNLLNTFYRIYPGGDEFAFIIQGDQSDAIGFSNRLVDQFEALSKRTIEVLGAETKLSFHCAIIEMDSRDTPKDIFSKAEECYKIAKEGTAAFTICWHPINMEHIFSTVTYKRLIYEKARQLFEVLTLQEVE